MQKNKRTLLVKTLWIFFICSLLFGGVLIYKYPYLPHAIASSIFRGQNGPGVYDLNISPYKEISTHSPSRVPISIKEIPTSSIDGFDSFNKEWESIAFLVSKEDTLIFEKYFEGHSVDKVSNSFSMAKTVISMLVGIAVDEGVIYSLDDNIRTYLPNYDFQSDFTLTIRDLLQMASGSNWDESRSNAFSDNAAAYYGKDITAFMHNMKVIHKPGVAFNYQSGNTQILGLLLREVYKKDISELVSEKIWSPMEMSHKAYWSADSKRKIEKAYCCLYATAQDFLKLGSLFIYNGQYQSKQIVPEWYIHEMINSKAPELKLSGNVNQLYGLQLWTYNDDSEPLVYFRGILGQYIIISPKNKWVAVRLGKKKGDNIIISSNDKSDLINEGHSKDFIEYVKFAKEIIKQVK